MQSHVVFGAGLIGCFLGGVLSHKKLQTRLVCRPAIKDKLSQGLTLTDYQDNSVKVENLVFIDSGELEHAGQCDVLWLTVKCTAVEQACADIHPLIGEDTIIMCCQNGLGSEQWVKKAFPGNEVLRVMVPFNVAELSPGHLHRGSEGFLTIEDDGQNSGFIRQLKESIQSPIMPLASSDQMQALLWAKLQLNLGNSINALADIPVKAMLEQRGYRKVIAAMMQELLDVTDRLNISLPKVTALPANWISRVLRLPDFLFLRVANKMLAIDPNVRTSMWWDLSQGKATEIDHLNGAIVSAASQLHIDCPVNAIVIQLIKEQERNNLQGIKREALSAQQLCSKVGV